MPNDFRSLIVASLVLALGSLSQQAYSDEAATSSDEATTQADADDSNTAESEQPAKPPAEEWKELNDRRVEIYERLVELRKAHSSADRERKIEIAGESKALISEFTFTIRPRLIELAPVVYKIHPDDEEAAEFVMQAEFQRNRYDKAAEIADKLLAGGRDSRAVMNTAAVSHFAIHDFERARELLQQAKSADKLDPNNDFVYLSVVDDYIDHWKKEQELQAEESTATGEDALPMVKLNTSKGPIELQLFENQAPNTVANFISLVESKKYDGTPFHRVINGFMAQGGDVSTQDPEAPGYRIECECFRDDARMHFQGSLSMAHIGQPDTGGAQFFITHLPTPHLNPDKDKKSGHTVFGRVTEGLDNLAAIEVGDTLESAEVVTKRNHEYKPKTLPPLGQSTPESGS